MRSLKPAIIDAKKMPTSESIFPRKASRTSDVIAKYMKIAADIAITILDAPIRQFVAVVASMSISKLPYPVATESTPPSAPQNATAR